MAAHRADKLAASLKRSAVATSVAKRTAEWVMSTDVPTDVLIEAGGISFALHKFPLVSRSGKIRKLVAGDSRDLDISYIKLSDLPGGPEAFELAAKFCYGINFEITVTNVATLRCAAAYLEMTEDYGDGNLVTRTEAFINEVATQSLPNAVAVLHSCEKLLPLAEELKIVTRCIDAAATEVCREQLSSLSSHTDFSMSERMESTHPRGATIDWWAEDLAVLRIDFYQRVLAAMLSRGLRHETVGAALMHYAHRALKGFSRKHATRTKLKVHDTTAATEHEQRVLVETIVSMLPRERNAIPCSFLFGLLRTAVILDTSLACRLDLEHRIGMQLEKATLDDLLVPAFSYSGDTLFDIDVIHRIVVSFLKQENDESSRTHLACDSDDDGTTPSQNALMRVAKLVDGYLAEIAPDPNLKVHKFIGLAELFPDHARLVDDSLYRAIDIYFKAHPTLTDSDKKKLCKLLDVQKLSPEACQHAAQNERLPVQMVVQVLYHEQMRLRSAMTSSYPDEPMGPYSQKPVGPGGLSAAMSPKDHYSSIRRENRELRLEVARMRMRLTDLEKDHVNMKEGIRKPGSSKLLSSFTKTLSKLNPFGKSKDASQLNNGGKAGTNSRRRRHSIS